MPLLGLVPAGFIFHICQATSLFFLYVVILEDLIAFICHLLQCRVLIVFRDGLITLWEIRESRSIFTTGGSLLQSQYHETKKVTSACWACPFGSRVAIGYSNGEIFIWSIPAKPNSRTELTSDSSTQNAPIAKLNLGFKADKIPIVSLKWFHADGKASRLYVMGASDFAPSNLLQVV